MKTIKGIKEYVVIVGNNEQNLSINNVTEKGISIGTVLVDKRDWETLKTEIDKFFKEDCFNNT